MKKIWVAGDFFLDEYNIGSCKGLGPRFKIEKTITRGGGAQNTYDNLRSICENKEWQLGTTGTLSGMVLRRWISKDCISLEAWGTVGRKGWPWVRLLNDEEPPCQTTLIISDYNKGAIKPGSYAAQCFSFNLVIVDSKYRTVPADLIKTGSTKIWHCTANEYNKEYAKMFDWIVHTNHDKSVTIFNSPKQISSGFKVNVPAVKVANPCGAGDTFTAALAAWLTNVEEITWDSMINATEFAVRCAQNVCKKPYTAITDVKLEK